jgi:threonine aldolase
MVDRLKDDHANAKLLGRGLSEIEGILMDLSHVQTNIALYDVTGLRISSGKWVAKTSEFGVKADAQEPRRVRMVTQRHREGRHRIYAERG